MADDQIPIEPSDDDASPEQLSATALDELPSPSEQNQLPPSPQSGAVGQAFQAHVSQTPRQPTKMRPAWLLAGAAAAIATDMALRQPPWNNLGGSLLVTTFALGLVVSGFCQTKTSRVFVGLSVVFGAFLSVRTEPFLVICTMIAAVGLLLAAALFGRERNFWDLRPMQVVSDCGQLVMESFVGMVEVPSEISAQARQARQQSSDSHVWPALRGIAIAVPLLIVLGILLASADVVFNSFFSAIGLPNIGSLLGHLALLALGAYAMMLLLRTAATQGGTDLAPTKASLGVLESTIILGGMILLFAGFALAQLLTVLGGATAALDRAGLDPKHFARQGFFQLLWVAAITLGVLMAIKALSSSNGVLPTALRWLSILTVALTLLIVGVALIRISFYIDDNGQTPLRFYAAIFSIWIAVCFAIVAVRIWGFKPETAWLLPAIVVSALVVVGALNVANPERIIALDNLSRDSNALIYHIREPQFTSDGYGVLAEHIELLSPRREREVTLELCAEHRIRVDKNESGWLRFNLGRSKAERELSALCD